MSTTTSHQSSVISHQQSTLWIMLATAYCLLPTVAQAAVSKGTNQQLEAGAVTQGGGVTTSSRFHQLATLGGSLSTIRITSSRFQIMPGALGAAAASSSTPGALNLDLKVLHMKAEPLTPDLTPGTWQQDRDPIFLWEPPKSGNGVAGYSFAIDADPDDVIDTTATSYDLANDPTHALSDGKHTFSVKALNSAGHSGAPLAIAIWVDTTAPQIAGYTPSPGTLLNTLKPAMSAKISDLASGVTPSTVSLLVNGSLASTTLDAATGTLTATGGNWKEGTNNLELRASDAVGNAQTPVVWSVTVDTQPPTGTVSINAGATLTTSAYVTLGLAASDAGSGIAKILLSNDEQTGYVEEPYVALRELWKLNPIRGPQRVFVKFIDKAGNVSAPVSDEIELVLLAPETVITSGPAGFTPSQTGSLTFMCPEGGCVFSYAFDNDAWSAWSADTTATKPDLAFGNHYFRVKAAREVNKLNGIQPDEEDPSPAERTWIVGVEPSMLTLPKGPPIKVWRIE